MSRHVSSARGPTRRRDHGEAADGQAAIEACRRLAPDVILLDINMPGLGGLEAALTIKPATAAAARWAITGSRAAHASSTARASGQRPIVARGAGSRGLAARDQTPHQSRLPGTSSIASGHPDDARNLRLSIARDKTQAVREDLLVGSFCSRQLASAEPHPRRRTVHHPIRHGRAGSDLRAIRFAPTARHP